MGTQAAKDEAPHVTSAAPKKGTAEATASRAAPRLREEHDRPRVRARGTRYWPTLAMLSVLVPGAAAAASVGLYVAHARWPGVLNSDGPRSFLMGTGAALVAWLLAAVACRSFATPAGGNRTAYGELCQELDDLLAAQEGVDDDVADASVARERARRHIDYLERSLDGTSGPGRPWAEGTGYVELWRRVHRAEEALLLARSRQALVAAALNDYLRLDDSHIAKRESLQPRLVSAAVTLDRCAAALYMPQANPALLRGGAARANGHQDALPDPELTAHEEDAARHIVVTVRRAINEFRDDRRDGLVRARNHLMATILVTGTVTYGLLGVAFVRGASVRSIVAFSAFYLTGAIVGLFRQLRAASARDTVAEDDFGLAYARLLHAPLFSGLAAVGGVMLTALLTPVTVTGDTATATHAVPKLWEIFDLSKNQGGLVFAAVFGLTPSLIVSRLQTQAETYKADLKSSEAADTAPSPG